MTGKKVGFEVHETHGALWDLTDWRYAFLMGGRGNARSGTASRFVTSQLLGKEYTRGAIMRATREDIRASCWSEIRDRIIEQDIESRFHITENEMAIEYALNKLRAHGFRASSGSLTARLKSLAGYNIIWIEEAEEIGEKEFMTLDDSLRTVKGRIRIVFTLNTPPKNHWIIRRWFDLDPHPEATGFYIPRLKESAKDAIYIGGTYRENLPNLDQATVQRYQGYKQTKPPYYWHMIEGLSPETVTGRIYTGWRKIDSVPHEARFLGRAEDFGFDPDPYALLDIYYCNGGYILDEQLYRTGLLDEETSTFIKALPNPNALIIADSADPKAIEGQRRRGLNVLGVDKGHDSVRQGIKHVQGLRISYTARSVNLEAEYESYAWKRNKDSVEEDDHLGIEDPVCPNHLMSAARYGLTMLVKPSVDHDTHDRLFTLGPEVPGRSSNPAI